jgi:hypothetical protein
MRFLEAIILLSAVGLSQAEDQVPLIAKAQAWFDKAKTYVQNTAPAPVDAGAAAVASRTVTDITLDNWRSELAPIENVGSPQNWLIYVTGGNKTCQGQCGELDAKFNKSAAILAADPNGPYLGRIDCDEQAVLCTAWFAGPPTVWYIQVPGPTAQDQTRAPTPIYVKRLNITTTTVEDIVQIHTKKTYEEQPRLESITHPFDGTLALLGLNLPIGYILYYLQFVPSWSIMLIISFMTRTMM